MMLWGLLAGEEQEVYSSQALFNTNTHAYAHKTYIHTYTLMHTHVHAYTHVCIYTYTEVSIYMYAYIHSHTYMHNHTLK